GRSGGAAEWAFRAESSGPWEEVVAAGLVAHIRKPECSHGHQGEYQVAQGGPADGRVADPGDSYSLEGGSAAVVSAGAGAAAGSAAGGGVSAFGGSGSSRVLKNANNSPNVLRA